MQISLIIIQTSMAREQTNSKPDNTGFWSWLKGTFFMLNVAQLVIQTGRKYSYCQNQWNFQV